MFQLTPDQIHELPEEECLKMRTTHFEKIKGEIIDAFMTGKDYHGKSQYGHDITIVCRPPPTVLDGLDLTEGESLRFLYNLYDNALLYATVRGAINTLHSQRTPTATDVHHLLTTPYGLVQE